MRIWEYKCEIRARKWTIIITKPQFNVADVVEAQGESMLNDRRKYEAFMGDM